MVVIVRKASTGKILGNTNEMKIEYKVGFGTYSVGNLTIDGILGNNFGLNNNYAVEVGSRTELTREHLLAAAKLDYFIKYVKRFNNYTIFPEEELKKMYFIIKKGEKLYLFYYNGNKGRYSKTDISARNLGAIIDYLNSTRADVVIRPLGSGEIVSGIAIYDLRGDFAKRVWNIKYDVKDKEN